MPEAQPPQLMTHPQAPHAPPLGGVMAKWLAPTTESRIERIPCESIRQRPWLTEPDAEEILAPLRDSIGARGVVEPLLLRRHPHGGFEIVCGARRPCSSCSRLPCPVPAPHRRSRRSTLRIPAFSHCPRHVSAPRRSRHC